MNTPTKILLLCAFFVGGFSALASPVSAVTLFSQTDQSGVMTSTAGNNPLQATSTIDLSPYTGFTGVGESFITMYIKYVSGGNPTDTIRAEADVFPVATTTANAQGCATWLSQVQVGDLTPNQWYAITLQNNFNYTANENPYCRTYTNIRYGANKSNTNIVFQVKADVTNTNPYFIWQTTGASTFTGTRVISTTPANGETIATSTAESIGANIYVTDEQFVEGTRIEFSITKNETTLENTGLLPGIGSISNCSIGVGPFCIWSANQEGALSGNFEIPEAGYFEANTTAQITDEGRYTMVTKITKPSFSVLGQVLTRTTLTSTTTSFIAGELNSVDELVQDINTSIYTAIQNTASSSCAISTSWNLGDCIAYLVFPNATVFDQYRRLPELAGEKFPFSYVTSISETWGDLTATTTDNLPSLSYALGDTGITTGTPFEGLLTNVTVFSEDTVTEYAPSGFFDALKTLASIAIILTLFSHIFFATRNLIKT